MIPLAFGLWLENNKEKDQLLKVHSHLVLRTLVLSPLIVILGPKPIHHKNFMLSC
jgi:hypothetical protein